MVVKELKNLINFMESKYFEGFGEENSKKYALKIIEGLRFKFNISHSERKALDELEEEFKTKYTRYGRNKSAKDYIENIENTIKEIEDNEKEIPGDLVKNYKDITKKVEKAIQNGEELKEVARNHCKNLRSHF